MTMLGGSLPHPELEAVMTMAGRHFVSIPELEVAAGKRIAEMLKLPDGYTALVTSGAAAAIQSGLAGILTGGKEDFIRQLPDLTGMKSEVIIQKSHRNPFDHQLRSTGIKLIVIETVDQLRAAVNERTAMMHFSNFANAAGQDQGRRVGQAGEAIQHPVHERRRRRYAAGLSSLGLHQHGLRSGDFQRRESDSRAAMRRHVDRTQRYWLRMRCSTTARTKTH